MCRKSEQGQVSGLVLAQPCADENSRTGRSSVFVFLRSVICESETGRNCGQLLNLPHMASPVTRPQFQGATCAISRCRQFPRMTTRMPLASPNHSCECNKFRCRVESLALYPSEIDRIRISLAGLQRNRKHLE